MIRMTDIIKLGDSGKEKEKDRVKEDPRKDNAPPAEKQIPEIQEEQARIDTIEKKVAVDRERARLLYTNGIELVKEIYNKIKDKEGINERKLAEFINRFVDHLVLDEGELFGYFYEQPQGINYLYSHSVNVCLLALKIAQWLNLNKSDLVELGIASLLHDIGMVKMESIVLQPKKLKPKERIEVGKHALYSSRILTEVTNLKKELIAAVKYHHRKSPKDKSPSSRERNSIIVDHFSQVIALADIYEAATHSRAYKEAKLPHEAIKEIIEKENNVFEQEVIRTLVNHIGIYPIGSWVMLSTGEIGVVISLDSNYPLRSRINIIFDSRKNRLADTKIVDLIEHPHIFIDGPIDVSKDVELRERLNI